MSKSNIMLDFSLLKTNKNFRAIFIARLMSVLGIGMLNVAVPIQIYELTGSSLQVGFAVALDGFGMFVGLMLGGVMADRYDRRKLILFSRFICGIGFVLLALNSYLSASSVWAVYAISLWDGFFSAIGMTALLASIPHLVGRENVPTAGALSMLIVRIGSVVSPALAGVVIVSLGVTWNYGLAAAGTLCTLLSLVFLPSMKPTEKPTEDHPIKSMIGGFSFVFHHKVIRSVVALGTLEAVTTSIRVLFPALALTAFGGGAFEVGLMYAAVPVGSTFGALTSGWVRSVNKPGVVMLTTAFLAFMCVASLGLMSHLVPTLLILGMFGYFGSIGSLLQYSIVQGHTPDQMLGRMGSFWTAQDVVGDSAGAMGIGALGKILAPLTSLTTLGLGCASVTVLMAAGFKSLRNARLIDPDVMPENGAAEEPKTQEAESGSKLAGVTSS
ncbi:enterobactin transporter EntS [Marinomonas mediterranea]|uniref:Major facilitator superfamily MFS_1 n=1 Tax=Marinomonas mediterranea (strain ATCC 700492 / JCM 21426 / NBRC 103028 / MMB-1) TaxID=717774 RepID=F2JWF7_MARM1|nr:enterobactin transporter EntS [Marinomonas mediterranea]ADZ90630.1 major facilitator superfamily MFS_1 [Marinomonas mediterranea MMB-1]WCN08672.1 enterobactin transporter EntS [Marinomonas mediterranea]WCN16800.1 enterobactin transporter EntS [Marinomonas mediterranea MMB-1]